MKKLLAMLLALIMSLSNSTNYSIVDDKPYPGPNYSTDQASADSEEPDPDNEAEENAKVSNEELSKDDENAGYYTINVGDAPDYRHIKEKTSDIEATSCKTTPFFYDPRLVPSSTGYWFVDGVAPDLNDLKTVEEGGMAHKIEDPEKITFYTIGGYKKSNGEVVSIFKKGSYVVMPYDGKILTQGAMSLDSISLVCSKTIDKNNKTYYYKLLISGLQCWYCDFSRPGALDGGKLSFHSHTFRSLADKKIPAGRVIGLANKDTVIEVIPCDKNGDVTNTTEPVSIVDFYAQDKG